MSNLIADLGVTQWPMVSKSHSILRRLKLVSKTVTFHQPFHVCCCEATWFVKQMSAVTAQGFLVQDRLEVGICSLNNRRGNTLNGIYQESMLTLITFLCQWRAPTNTHTNKSVVKNTVKLVTPLGSGKYSSSCHSRKLNECTRITPKVSQGSHRNTTGIIAMAWLPRFHLVLRGRKQSQLPHLSLSKTRTPFTADHEYARGMQWGFDDPAPATTWTHRFLVTSHVLWPLSYDLCHTHTHIHTLT